MLYVPTAVNCRVVPTLIDGLTGLIAIETNVGCTVNVVVCEMLPIAAPMVEVPTPTPVASPPLLIVDTEVMVELHVTLVVIVFTLPSVYFPEAVNCRVPAVGIVGLTGAMVIDTRAGAITVRIVGPEMLPEAAAIVLVP